MLVMKVEATRVVIAIQKFKSMDINGKGNMDRTTKFQMTFQMSPMKLAKTCPKVFQLTFP